MPKLPSSAAWILLIYAFAGCQSPALESAQTVECMRATPVYFSPGAPWDSLAAQDGWTRWDNGRLLTQTFPVPEYRVRPTITAVITLRSAGDPWDKSGSLMLLPNAPSGLLERGFTADSTVDFPGILLEQTAGALTFAPPVELLRFITPFGVGHFSKQERLDAYRPVYVPHWEDSVHWEADISHLWEALGDSMTLGLYIDTWTAEGYSLDVDIRFEGRHETIAKLPSLRTIPLLNTSKFGSEQRHYDALSRAALSVQVELPERAANAVLHYTVTGHGGHGTGDEFVPSEHRITWNGDSALTFTPWRDDCASFRRFNPSSGVWFERTFWKGDSLDERIASSDYSRTGWCPGSQVDPVRIPLGDLEAGKHELVIAVPTAQPFTESEMNFWNVAAYLTYEAH